MTDYSPKQTGSAEITEKDLKGYFLQFAKPKGQHRFGAECEVFGLFKSTGQPIPYFGSRGIEGVLASFVKKFGWSRREEHAHVIALARGGDFITLEPGGQIELSASPVHGLAEVSNQINSFHAALREIGKELGIAWLSMGTQPLATAGEMPWVPKARYEIMKQYLASHGTRSHDMMQRTATNQFNIDFENESDAIEIMKLVFRISPFIIAAFANSPLFEGKITGYQSYRIHIWQGTDPDRTGLLQLFTEGGGSFEEYLDYVLDVPLLFIIRNSEWIALNGLPFRSFLKDGFGQYRATMEDFRLHLTTLFPECRLKDHIEIRCADAQAAPFIMAVFSFWVGILSNSETRRAALDEVKDLTWVEVQELYHDLAREGLSTKVGVSTAGEISKRLFQIALFGLKRSDRSHDDRKFLEPFYEKYVEQQKTLADELLERWDSCKARKWPEVFEHLLI